MLEERRNIFEIYILINVFAFCSSLDVCLKIIPQARIGSESVAYERPCGREE